MSLFRNRIKSLVLIGTALLLAGCHRHDDNLRQERVEGRIDDLSAQRVDGILLGPAGVAFVERGHARFVRAQVLLCACAAQAVGGARPD